ncbi:alpha/beta hydrolase family protein [Gryllotalpicola protaetiae]|uniref:S9 family peptidase n=1 Tax=Gryllotalpicola protaetiae TaxID=2419771 RepID=A0A387BVC2_9MICO|nr:S9 family peptidase [Gryllotalpicola protaetiae]AYG04817.1 S9 family peptidase [Gryllotalpicola protaetiae]
MKPADLPLINTVSAPSLHPGGGRAVVAVTRPDLDADSYVGQLWVVPLSDDAAAFRLTRGFRDTAPRFSPDGGLIAFLRATPSGPAQLYVVAADGGEPVQVTDRKLGVGAFAWSPDGAHLAFSSREPEAGRYGTVEGVGPDAERARRFDGYHRTSNGLGYYLDRPNLLFVAPTPDVRAEPLVQPVGSDAGPAEPRPLVAEPLRISRHEVDHGDFAFSPDGRILAAVAAVHATRDEDLRSSVVLLPIEGDAEAVDATITYGDLSVDSVEYGPDGRLFFVASEVGAQGVDFVGRNSSLYVISAPGARPQRLTDPAQHDLGANRVIVPLADGSVLTDEGSRGTHQLVRVGTEGSVTALTSGDVEVSGADAAGGTIVVGCSHPGSYGDVAVVEDGRLRTLTDFSAALRARGIVTPVELTVPGNDGYPVHGWIAVPEGDGPHPVLLMIHGGPFAEYGVHLFDETQVLAAAGYAVVYCNPRGSRTYGESHGRSIRQAMGTVDLDDVLAFLDGAVAADARLDGSRTGILGGSYGGYLTAWAIAHEHRFAGAVVERGYLDPEYFVGTSDIGWFFSGQYVGDDPERIAAQSPQAVVDRVTTPTLVLHSEQDLRCPLGQAERYYHSLKRNGVETELVVFPGENHELSRGGRPRHRVQRFEIILDWWQRHLPV